MLQAVSAVPGGPSLPAPAKPVVHPLAADAEGDAAYHQSVGSGAGSQPALDLRQGDVALVDGTVKLTMRILDLATPPDSDGALGGPPDAEQYVAQLGYGGGAFQFSATRRVGDGSWTSAGEWCPSLNNCRPVDHVSRQVDMGSGLVVVSVDLVSMNQALSAAGSSPPVEQGSELSPSFMTQAVKTAPTGDVLGVDTVDTATPDPAGPAYQLGS